MLEVDVDLTAALGRLANAKEEAGKAVKYAVAKAAWMVRLEVEERAPRSEAAHWFYSTASGGVPHVFSRGKNKGRSGSKYLFRPGDLKKSIYMAEVKEESVPLERAVYRVSFRKVSTSKGYVPYARWVEFGTVRMPAVPFLRPAFDAKRMQAEQMIVEIVERAVYGG